MKQTMTKTIKAKVGRPTATVNFSFKKGVPFTLAQARNRNRSVSGVTVYNYLRQSMRGNKRTIKLVDHNGPRTSRKPAYRYQVV